MTDALPRRAGVLPLVAVLTLATCLALAIGAGDPVTAITPVLVVAVAWEAWRAPLRNSVSALFLLVLVVDNPQERPAAGMWQSPLYGLGSMLFENLNKLTGIEELRIASVDLIIAALAVLAVYRGAHEQIAGVPGAARPSAALTRALLLSLVGLAMAEAWGLATGGDLKGSLWQVRQLAAVPVLTLVMIAACPQPSQMRIFGSVVVGAACFKALEGLYFYEVICRPKNFKPPYVTIHSDTMIFVGALVLGLILWHERGKLPSWLWLLAAPLLALAIYINGRRLAYVALGGALLTIFAVIPRTRLKRTFLRAVVFALPVLALYLAAGWSSTTEGVFRPARMVRSVVSAEGDRSTQTRDIENYNLTRTLGHNAVLGAGFGHEYDEVSKADDISRLFQQYRLIPHNSFLGLWAFAGILGFWLVWLPMVVGLFLATRIHARARSVEDRTMALAAIALFVIYAIQAYGVMGLQSWEGTFLLSAALASTSRLSVAVGAWPGQPVQTAGIEATCSPSS